MDPLFFDLHSGLMHEAPGSTADTLAALKASGLAGPADLLDAGCGPGAASLTLLKALPQARITAVDLHAPFVEAARAQAAVAGVGDRLRAMVADMTAPPVEPGSLDAVWSEGAAYSVGIETALTAWRSPLKPGGRVIFSELIWTHADPHPDAAAFWAEEYPAMTDRCGVRDRIGAAGYRALVDLPVSQAGWAGYYGPLEARVEALASRVGADHPVLVAQRAEHALWKTHGDAFEYRFFVAAA